MALCHPRSWLGQPPKGHSSWKDPDIVAKVAHGDFVLVNNNRRDFVGRYYRKARLDMHRGLIVILRKSDREGEKKLSRQLMHHIPSMESTVNKLVAINADGNIRVADWTDLEMEKPWRDPFQRSSAAS